MKNFAIFGVLLAMTAGVSARAEVRTPQSCTASAKAMAKALSAAAFNTEAGQYRIEATGETENSYFTVTVQSKPFAWGDGVIRPQVLKYELTFDNEFAIPE